jgi:signal transduction histidine kinase
MSFDGQLCVASPNLRGPSGRVQKPALDPGDPDWACHLAGGEMGARIRAFDWSSTPLGPLGAWPSALREAVSLCLRSRFQLAIYWGPQLVLLYNDAERDVLGALHPNALGRPAAEILADMWDVVGPMLHGVLATGEATWSVDQPLPINRHGFLEEAFFTYSYSPIPDRGGIGGVLLVTVETTQRVLAERRLRTLRELAAEAATARSVDEVCARAAGALADNPSDLPFSLLYVTEDDGTPRLAASTGVARAPDPDRWPLREVALTRRAERVEDVAARLPGRGTALPRSALVLPIVQADRDTATGCLVVGLSDMLAFDEAYRGFLDLVAAQIAAAIAGARALEAERHRAEALAAFDAAKTTFFTNVSELERRVAERTRELCRANARLAKQIARGRRLEEARKELRRRLVHAQEEEHRRIARELHDDLTQRLAVLAIDAEMLRQTPGHGEDVSETARGIRDQLVALSESVHTLSRQLHPSILDDLGLVNALHAECQSLGERDGITVKYDAQGVPTDLPRDVALCVYRVAQEALRNVAFHARCRRASVRLAAAGGELVLRVRDRGAGFDPAGKGKTGIGLESIRERASLIGARLAVRSRPGAGTQITLRVPLQTRSQA